MLIGTTPLFTHELFEEQAGLSYVSAVLIHQAHEEYFVFGQVLQEVQVIKQSGRVAFLLSSVVMHARRKVG